MAIQGGLSTKIYVDTADVADPVGGAPTWVELPNQLGGGKQLNRQEASANHKGNAGWADSIAVSREWQIPVQGFTDENDTAYLFIHDTKALNALTDVTINVKIQNAAGDTFIGIAALLDFSEDFPTDGIVQYSLTLKGRGAPTQARA